MTTASTKKLTRVAAGCLLLFCIHLQAQTPQLINYQGRVAVDAVNFDGTGQFKFALVNALGTDSGPSSGNGLFQLNGSFDE